jgi:hypothetical protein
MNEETARKVANVTMGVAAIGMAYIVLKTPPLRRAAWNLAIVALTGSVPAWLNREVGTAWADSGKARR